MSEVALASAQVPSTRQRLFNRYFSAILLDMAVPGLFAEACGLVGLAIPR